MITLNNLKWYRKFRGGKWIQFTPRPYPYMTFWKKEPYKLLSIEKVIDREDYTKP